MKRHAHRSIARPASGAALATAVLAIGSLSATGAAAAELPSHVTPLDTRSDGVYGRFDGDVSVNASALLELSPGGPAPAVRAAAHYLWMAGAYVGLGRITSGPASDQVLSAGVEFRPAFVPRWTLGLETGPSFVDLAIDSISLSLGAFWASPQGGEFGDELGLELGLGGGVPLTGSARGPWLEARGVLRAADDAPKAVWCAQLGLSWSWGWQSPMQD